MGQQVVALMYGISSKTKGLTTPEGDWLWDDCRDGVPATKRLEYGDAKAPQSVYEGGVLGFPVATGPACNREEGFLGETASLVDLEKTHAKHIKEAKRRWALFAEWLLATHGKRLPEPTLWITADERA